MWTTRILLSAGLLSVISLGPAAAQQNNTRQAPETRGGQATAAPGRQANAGRGAVTPPPLLFREAWRLDGRPRAIAPGENVVSNPELELKVYGPCATATDPDQRLWISGAPENLWTGMCIVPVAATLRHKTNYVDLSGLGKMRWVVRTSGFHQVRPVVKLADGTFLVGDHADSSTTTFTERELAFTGLRWMRLDVNRVVTTGTYGTVGEASNWLPQPDLSRVDEVGFVDLMPGSGHGSGGWANVALLEVYGKLVARAAGTSPQSD